MFVRPQQLLALELPLAQLADPSLAGGSGLLLRVRSRCLWREGRCTRLRRLRLRLLRGARLLRSSSGGLRLRLLPGLRLSRSSLLRLRLRGGLLSSSFARKT